VPSAWAGLYAKYPKSIGAALVKAIATIEIRVDGRVCRGMFDNLGVKYQRSDLLTLTQSCHRKANDGKTNPEHETVGRELRRRGTGKRQQVADRLWVLGWDVKADDGRVWLERRNDE
jgi:hypothetical protein